jgi:hypothetical protein
MIWAFFAVLASLLVSSRVEAATGISTQSVISVVVVGGLLLGWWIHGRGRQGRRGTPREAPLPATTAFDCAGLTVPELRQQLRDYNLDATGNRRALVARLELATTPTAALTATVAFTMLLGSGLCVPEFVGFPDIGTPPPEGWAAGIPEAILAVERCAVAAAHKLQDQVGLPRALAALLRAHKQLAELAPPPPRPPGTLRVAQLRTELLALGLDTDGVRAELSARLEAARLAAVTEPAAAAPPAVPAPAPAELLAAAGCSGESSSDHDDAWEERAPRGFWWSVQAEYFGFGGQFGAR